MKRYLFKILIFIVLVLTSCSNDVTIQYYDTGEIKSKIYFVKNDTSKLIDYTKKGVLQKEKFFYSAKNESIEIVYGTDSVLKKKKVIINRGGKKHGIIRHYKDMMIIQKDFYIKDTPLASSIIHAGLLENTQPEKDYYYKVFQVRLLSGNRWEEEGIIEYNKDNQIVKERSHGYVVYSKDTIEEGESFSYEVEFLKEDIDSVFFAMYLGEIDSNGQLLDTVSEVGGWNTKYKIIINQPETGYNLITGHIEFLIPKLGTVNTMFFYHDFYVKPKEE